MRNGRIIVCFGGLFQRAEQLFDFFLVSLERQTEPAFEPFIPGFYRFALAINDLPRIVAPIIAGLGPRKLFKPFPEIVVELITRQGKLANEFLFVRREQYELSLHVGLRCP